MHHVHKELCDTARKWGTGGVDLINLLRDLADTVEELSADKERLHSEVEAWRDCVLIDAQMEGAVFKGFNRDQGRRVFEKYWKP